MDGGQSKGERQRKQLNLPWTWAHGPVQFPGDAIGAWWLVLCYNTCPSTRSVLCPEERGPQLSGSSPSCLEEKMIGSMNTVYLSIRLGVL